MTLLPATRLSRRVVLRDSPVLLPGVVVVLLSALSLEEAVETGAANDCVLLPVVALLLRVDGGVELHPWTWQTQVLAAQR